MRLMEKAKSYKTQKNAFRKLYEVLGRDLENHNYLIAATSSGRFVPVITGHRQNKPYYHLAHKGIAVVG